MINRRYLRSLIVAISLLLAAEASAVSFQAARTWKVGEAPGGEGPVSTVAGDFNRDGKIDLATANFRKSAGVSVSILIGNGNGTFRKAVDYEAGREPVAIAVRDFNRDGKLDLAVANFAGGSVSVLLGNGDGTFKTAVHYATGYEPTSIAVNDFNGDGEVDLAVTNSLENTVSILSGYGNGTFKAAGKYQVGAAPYFVAVGDFNGDHRADLALANYYSGSISILIGTGSGTFKEAVNYAVGPEPFSVAVSDFNKDGKFDLAVANSGSNTVSILFGNGNGTFRTAVNYKAGSGPDSVRVVDLNGDGNGDLAVANYWSGNVSILFGNRDGTFSSPVDYASGAGSQSVSIADFNKDGKIDLAVANREGGDIAVLIGDGRGGLKAARTIRAGALPSAVAMGDFNGDGKADLAVGHTDEVATEIVSIFLGKGDGTFWDTTDYTLEYDSPPYIVVGDFNRDGKADLAVANSNGIIGWVSILFGKGDGAFMPPVNYETGLGASFIAIRDFNKDGIRDLAVANYNASSVSILLGNADGTFRGAVNYELLPLDPTSIAIGDFNGDGNEDLAVNGIKILFGNGDGTFRPLTDTWHGYGYASAAAGDFNRDGKIDIAGASEDGVEILLGNGDGTFKPPVNVMGGGNYIVTGDFNLDGQIDLAVTRGGGIAILMGGLFKPPVDYATGRDPVSLAVGDLNGDGGADIVVANYFSSDIAVLLNTSYLGEPPAAVLPHISAAGPMDGATDVAVSTRITAGFTKTMNGSTLTNATFILTDPAGHRIAGVVSYDGTTASFAPAKELRYSTTYTATITTAAADVDGLHLPLKYRWSFKTEAFLKPFTEILTGSWPAAVAIGDVNGDGLNDVLMTTTDMGNDPDNDYKLFVFLQNSLGSLNPPIRYSTHGTYTSRPESIAIGDVTGDGRNDIVIGCSGYFDVFVQNSSGGLNAPVKYAGGSYSIKIGDLNGDGLLDVAGIGTAVNVFLQNGKGGLMPPASLSVNHGGFDELDVGDVNNDGKTDIIVMSGQGVYPNIGVLIQQPDATFAPAAYYNVAAGELTQGVEVGDITGDGRKDIVVTYGGNSPGSRIGVFAQNTLGTLNPAKSYPSYDIPTAVEIGDIDGDGRRDVIVKHSGWLKMGVYIQGANGVLQKEMLFDVPMSQSRNPQGLAVGDINSDGRNDIVIVTDKGIAILYHR